MCIHGNHLLWGIKHLLINLGSKYRSPGFIHLSTMLAPVISILDEIYCINLAFKCGWSDGVLTCPVRIFLTSTVTYCSSLLSLLVGLSKNGEAPIPLPRVLVATNVWAGGFTSMVQLESGHILGFGLNSASQLGFASGGSNEEACVFQARFLPDISRLSVSQYVGCL